MITLLPEGGTDQMIELQAGADGKLLMETSWPGQYELTMGSGKTVKVSVPALPPPREVEGAWELISADSARRLRYPAGTDIVER